MADTHTFSHVPHDAIQFLDKKKFVYIWGSKLPHWFQEHKTTFITFRLADSLPQTKIEELLYIKRRMQQEGSFSNDAIAREVYNETIISKMDEWIDAGYGGCILKEPKTRRIVYDAIHYFDGKQYVLHSFVIMPNHVHILLTPICDIPILNYIGEIKRFTAVRINRLLHIEGKIWQKGTFDRLVRDSTEFQKYWDYIIKNPRFLSADCYTLYTRDE